MLSLDKNIYQQKVPVYLKNKEEEWFELKTYPNDWDTNDVFEKIVTDQPPTCNQWLIGRVFDFFWTIVFLTFYWWRHASQINNNHNITTHNQPQHT